MSPKLAELQELLEKRNSLTVDIALLNKKVEEHQRELARAESKIQEFISAAERVIAAGSIQRVPKRD